MFIALPLIIAILGLLCYALSSNPKVQVPGLITFGIGLFYFVGSVTASGSAVVAGK